LFKKNVIAKCCALFTLYNGVNKEAKNQDFLCVIVIDSSNVLFRCIIQQYT